MSRTFARSEPWISAVANQKGGVGKTTTSVNVAAALARRGVETTLIDLDPQGNATTTLGVELGNGETAFDLLAGATTLAAASRPTRLDQLRVVPASVDLASIDQQLGRAGDRLSRLSASLTGPLPSVVLIDCPPTLGLLTLNALACASGVMIPLQSEFLALDGLSQLFRTLREVRQVNPDLRVDGVVLTMHDQRNNLAQQVEADARENLGDLVFDTVIPRNVRLSEAPSYGLSIFDYDPQSRGAKAYEALAAEFLARLPAERIPA